MRNHHLFQHAFEAIPTDKITHHDIIEQYTTLFSISGSASSDDNSHSIFCPIMQGYVMPGLPCRRIIQCAHEFSAEGLERWL